MKTFFKWLGRKIQNSNCDQDIKIKEDMYLSSNRLVAAGSDFNSHSLNFKVYKASGGSIIETSSYDRKTDRHNNSLYIITDDKDLGKEIGKIITLESLKN